MTDLEKATEGVIKTSNKMDDSFAALDAAILTTEQLLNTLFDPKGKLSEVQRKYLEDLDGIRGVLKTRVENISRSFGDELEATGTIPEDIAQRTALLDSFLDSRVDTVLVKANEQVKKANEEVKKMAANFSASISKAFSDMVMKGEFSAKKIGDAFLKSAMEAASQKFIAKPLSGFFDSLFGSIFGRAGGGAVGANVPVLVGERGPEVFVPRMPGAVLNSHDSRRALGGGRPVTINQTLHFTSDVSNSVRAEIMNAAPLIANQAAHSVMNSMRGIRT